MSIQVFGRDMCAPCKTVKYWLKSKNYEYEEIDAESHIDELKALGFMSVPVIKVNDRYFNNLPALAGYLNSL